MCNFDRWKEDSLLLSKLHVEARSEAGDIERKAMVPIAKSLPCGGLQLFRIIDRPHRRLIATRIVLSLFPKLTVWPIPAIAFRSLAVHADAFFFAHAVIPPRPIGAVKLPILGDSFEDQDSVFGPFPNYTIGLAVTKLHLTERIDAKQFYVEQRGRIGSSLPAMAKSLTCV